jgi:hypothetical protein
MNPNDGGIVRVFTREVGATVPDFTLKVANPFEVVVEGEAGSVLAASGVPYNLILEALDITAGANPGGNFSKNLAEAFTAANGWPQYNRVVNVAVDAGFVANHIYQYYVALVATNEIVTIITSPPFILIT